MWNLAQQRAPGETKVNVYNPDFEQHGWQSPHTVIEIVSDDMPFIVDSVTMELGRQGYGIDLVIHPVVRVRRDDQGRLTEVLEPGAQDDGAIAESVIHAEVVRERDTAELQRLRENLDRVLGEVRARGRGLAGDARQAPRSCTDELEREPPPVDPAELQEVRDFLKWVSAHHFTFLGYREYDLVQRGRGGRPGGRPGLRPGDPSQRPADRVQAPAAEGARARARTARARADQGQLAIERPPAGVSRLHRRQEVRARRQGHR